MKQMHLVWALICAGCGGNSFSADGHEGAPDAAAHDDSGAPSIVRASDDAGRAGASSSGGSGEGGAGGSSAGTGGIGGALEEDAGVVGGAGGALEGGAGGEHSAGAGGTGGVDVGGAGGIGGVGGASDGGTGGSAGCELVTHENGLGQTWEDCVELGTYDTAQAFAACEAWWCAANGGCVSDPPANVCYTASACGEIAVLGTNGAGTYAAWSRLNGSVWLTDALGGGCIWTATWR